MKKRDLEIMHAEILHGPIFKALCAVSMPQRKPKRKVKPKPASQHWNRIK